MDTSEILKKVRKIEIKTRRLSANIFAGQYHSAFKGKGMAFSEVREYQFGDDVRDIDWNVTARYSKPFIKVFEEEREMTVMLMVDLSDSQSFGVGNATKREIVAEMAATLAFSTIQNNDKIGVVFFTDKIEKFIPPKKGKKHILFIIRELIGFQPENNKTDINMALEYLTNVIKRRCTTFIISDFIDNRDFSKAMSIANNKHDIIALQVFDKRDTELPNIGLVNFKDFETGEEMYVDTASARVRKIYRDAWLKSQENMKKAFNKSRVDSISVSTDQDYVKALMSLFKMRG